MASQIQNSSWNFKVETSMRSQELFFLINLSEWGMYYRPAYNQAWLEDNPLSEDEKAALTEMYKLLEIHGYDDDYFLAKAFFGIDERRVWNEVESKLGKRKCSTLKNIFQVFEPRFKYLRPGWKKSLLKLSKVFTKSLESEKANNIISALNSFYNKEIKSISSTVSLFVIPANGGSYGGGGQNISAKRIELEVPSDVTPETMRAHLLTMWHELYHANYYGPYMENLINDVTSKEDLISLEGTVVEGYSWQHLIDELVIASLLPNGVLAMHSFNYEPDLKNIQTIRDYPSLSRSITIKLFGYVASYIQKAKPVDEKLLLRFIESVKERIY